MNKIKLCHCIVPNLEADSKGMAVCTSCGNYFNKEHWEAYHNAKIDKAVKKQKIGRNDHCQCQSGKKYKKCCAIRKIVGLAVRPVVDGKPVLDGLFDNGTIHTIPWNVRPSIPSRQYKYSDLARKIGKLVRFNGQLTVYVDREMEALSKELDGLHLDNLIVSDPAGMGQDVYDKYRRTGGCS